MSGHVRISNESIQQIGDISCRQTLRNRGIICRISGISKYKGRDKNKIKTRNRRPTPKPMLAQSWFRRWPCGYITRKITSPQEAGASASCGR